MSRSLAGKVALVTGASSGIGWELARQLARAGVKVAAVARREGPLRELAA
ncbi:MAG: SDR family NAD(P)-dependent oxidoreductase, partial [Planctomycetes bacterium]|nr:SDR family NAD(P)-dependent oxidoreductase [Planctomycetota bacterium]